MLSNRTSTWAMAFLALGVVYGDIGTSPLYALRECMSHGRFEVGNELTVLGPVSLMIWSLTVIVAVKYVWLLSRADLQGEGGTFALYGLLRQGKAGLSKGVVSLMGLMVLVAAALMYGDGMITPAISVLSAVEGLELVNLDLPGWSMPAMASVIIIGIFWVQKYGTGRIGVSFGPIMVIWFVVLSVLGVVNLVKHPGILWAFSPYYGISYLIYEGAQAWQVMGTVLLAVTGCEALYADMGHFGRGAIKRAWFFAAYPALMLNYLGQGALLLSEPGAVEHLFFHMAPEVMRIPLVVLATMATAIASQAMITGVFSLTQQAVQLGFVPRLKIVHTSSDVRGQIYMPQVNFILGVACLILVLVFQKSSALAAAYGLSVSSVMVVTSGLLFLVMRKLWGWSLWKALLPVSLFLVLELGYWVGSLSKIIHGAWVPMVITLLLVLVMKTWRDGRAILMKRVLRSTLPASHLVDEIKAERVLRVPGIGVFLSSSSDGLPLVLLHHLKHNKVLHDTAILLTVKFTEEAYVAKEKRTQVVELHESFYRVILSYGFAESANVMRDLSAVIEERKFSKKGGISYYQSRELLLTEGRAPMARWRKGLFVALSRMARPATGYFQLPSRQVIELGIQLEL